MLEVFMIWRLAICVSLFAACGGTQTISPELRRKAATIRILTPDDIGERELSVIREVSGLSCAVQAGASPSMDAAREDLRVEAAKAGADALSAVICREGDVDLGSNCWKTIRCTGDAIRWKSSL